VPLCRIGRVFFARGILAQAKNGNGEGRGDFFHLSLVPNVFPLHSFKFSMVPIRFPRCSQHVLHSTSLLSHMFWQMLSSFHLYKCAKGKELYISKIEPSIWRCFHNFILLSDGPIKLALLQEEELGRHLI
jgi:hypothetical protein